MSTSMLMFLFCLHINDVDLCSSNMCITCNSSPRHITLICTIKQMYLRIVFVDPHGNTQADCLPPYTNQCEAYYKNGSISINVTTNTVSFTMNGIIDQSLNGYWGCRHGMRREKAETYISIGNNAGNQKTHGKSTHKKRLTGLCGGPPAYETQTTSMTEQSTSHGSSTVSSLKTMSTEILQMWSTIDRKSTMHKKQNVTKETSKMKGFLMMLTEYGSVLGGVVIILLFVSCNFWIWRRCKKVHVKLPEINTSSIEEKDNSLRATSIEIREFESCNSGYETINELEMIPSSFSTASMERFSTSSRNQQTSKQTSICYSHSSSDRSYLEVIGDITYLNPYQSVDVTDDVVDNHTYCMITDECKYDIPYLSVQTNMKKEMYKHPSIEQLEIDVASYMQQVPKISDNFATASRIAPDCSDITSLDDSSDTVYGKLSNSKRSIENIATFICDDASFKTSNVLKGQDVMSTLL